MAIGVGVDVPKSFAVGFGKKLAQRLGAKVRVCTMALVERAKDFECVVDDLTLAPTGGASTVGRWGTDVTSEHGDNWDEICDGKSYFAVSALMRMAAATMLDAECDDRERFVLRAPPSLGSARLDALAREARLADRAQLTELAGRACVRITNEGTTLTSFLDHAERDALRSSGLTFVP
jgi:hypothetical protein